MTDDCEHCGATPMELHANDCLGITDIYVGTATMTAITHIAGLTITIGGQYQRQRCGWCGAVLQDYDLSRVAVPLGQDPTPPFWDLGALVRVDGSMTYLVEATTEQEGVDNLPEDSCARLDPEVTV